MIGGLNRVAIVAKDFGKASAVNRDTLGAVVSDTVHGVTTVLITLPNTTFVELE